MSTMIYGCRDCRAQFGIVQWLCYTCFLESDTNNLLYKKEHEFAKCNIIHDLSLPDDHKDIYHCKICSNCSLPSPYPHLRNA